MGAALPQLVGSQLQGCTMQVQPSPPARSQIWSTSGNVCVRMIICYGSFPRSKHRGQPLCVRFLCHCYGSFPRSTHRGQPLWVRLLCHWRCTVTRHERGRCCDASFKHKKMIPKKIKKKKKKKSQKKKKKKKKKKKS